MDVRYAGAFAPRKTWTKFLLLYAILGLSPLLYRYALIELGAREMFFDATRYWLPIAKELNDGAVLYVTSTHDNKTPLWHGLNYLMYITGQYTASFYLLTGICNTLSALLLWRWVERDAGEYYGGLFAGILFLTTLPIVNGDIINVRTYALLVLVAALLARRPWARGAFAAGAVLFSQQFVFALPILAYREYRQTDRLTGPLTVFIVAFVVVAALPFLVIGLIWSEQATIAGFRMSVLGADDYLVGHADHFNPFMYPKLWANHLVQTGMKLLFAIVTGVFGLGYWLRHGGFRQWNGYSVATTLAISFGATLFLRSLPYYWIPVLAFLSATAGIAAVRAFRSRAGSGYPGSK